MCAFDVMSGLKRVLGTAVWTSVEFRFYGSCAHVFLPITTHLVLQACMEVSQTESSAGYLRIFRLWSEELPKFHGLCCRLLHRESGQIHFQLTSSGARGQRSWLPPSK